MVTNNLSSKKCRPCEGAEKPLGAGEIAQNLRALEGWAIAGEDTLLFREYTLKDFMEAVCLIDKIAEIAQEQGHHPDLHLTGYKRLRVELTTHAVGGLSENDFIMAARIEEIFRDVLL
jgi:4a-hydroxytetrahydrobiopterin dehydratase